MINKIRFNAVALVGALALSGGAANAQVAEYEVTILPPIPDSFATVVQGLNNNGDLVGYAQFNPNPYYLRGWKWSAAEGMVLLPAPPGVDTLRYAARDINDAGVIVGDGGGDSGEAWRLENGVYTLLGTIEGDPLSTGVGINESLVVVGFSGSPSIGHAKHLYRYTDDEGMVTLLFGKATGINESRQISGYSEWASGGGWQAARISPTGDVLFLGVLPGRNDSFGYGINQFGQVVGTSRRNDSSTAFVYTDGVGMQALPEVSRWNSAGEINSMGTIIGNGGDPNQAYVWTSSTGSRLLTDLIDPALQITVRTAVDLNEFGQIAAWGFDVGNRVWVQMLLTPKNVEIMPESLSVTRGFVVAGTLQDLFASDDLRLDVRAGLTLFLGESPLQVSVTGTSLVETPSELRFKLESSANTPGLTQTIELFNYDTSSYEQVDLAIPGPTDGIVEVVITTNPGRFVQAGTREMRARLVYRQIGLTLLWPWSARLDQAVWTIVP